MAFDGTLKFDTGIDSSGFETGISGLGNIAKKGMDIVAGAIKLGTDALIGFGKKAVDAGSNFESSMAQVIATMGITRDTVQDGANSYELLKQAAADAGESTTFSASEAADALNYLALAGYSAAQAADALPSVLDLAAAGGMDLAYASDLATDSMAALGIEATKENLTHFGDQLAKTASKANASVAQLGEAILVVGGTAKSLAGGTTELNAALGVLANRGIKGAEGGTALRNMILSLSAPTDKARAQLKALGVEVLDAEGNMRPLNETFRDLNAALADVSDGEKTQILNNIFNKVDLKSANAMLAGCWEEFDNLTAELEGCDGAMSQMAKTMNDTLEGDMKSLGSKAEALGIAVYEGLNAPLRELAQLGGKYISQLTEAFRAGSFDGIAEALGNVLGEALTQLTSYLPDVTKLGLSAITSLAKGLKSNAPQVAKAAMDIGKTLITGLAAFTVQLGETAAVVLGSLANELAKHPEILADTASAIITQFADSVTSYLPVAAGAFVRIAGTVTAALSEVIPQFAGAIAEGLPMLIRAGMDIITALAGAVSDNLDILISSALLVVSVLCESLLNGENLRKLLDAGITLLLAVAQAIVDNLPVLIDAAVQVLAFLANELLAPENLLKLIEAGVQIIIALTDAIVDNLDTLLMACETIIITLVDELLKPENLAKLVELGAKLLAKLIEGLGKIAGKLLGFAGCLFDELDSTLSAIDWENLGTRIVEGIASGLLDCDFVLDDFMEQFGDNWVSGIKDIFGIHSPSKVMHDEVGAYLASGIGEGFADRAQQVAQDISQAVSGWVTLFADAAKTAGKSYLDGIHKFLALLPGDTGKQLSAALDSAAEFGKSLIESGITSAEDFLNGITDFLHRLPDMTARELADTLHRVVSWGADMVRTGIQAAQDMASGIIQAVQNLPGTMAGIGANIVSGIWNGITSMGGWLYNQVSGFASGIIDSFRETLGIASPSKVMRDTVGRNLVLGIAEGITREGSAVVRAVQDISDAVSAAEITPPEVGEPEIPAVPEQIVSYVPATEEPEIPEIPAQKIVFEASAETPELPEIPEQNIRYNADMELPEIPEVPPQDIAFETDVKPPELPEIEPQEIRYSADAEAPEIPEIDPQAVRYTAEAEPPDIPEIPVQKIRYEPETATPEIADIPSQAVVYDAAVDAPELPDIPPETVRYETAVTPPELPEIPPQDVLYGTSVEPPVLPEIDQQSIAYRADFTAPELPDTALQLPDIIPPELPEINLHTPEVDIPELNFPEANIPQIEIPQAEIEIPEIESPVIRFEIPELPELTAHAGKMPAIEPDALRLMQAPQAFQPALTPSPTSTVVNNTYTYNTTTTNNSTADTPRPLFNIHAVFEVDGERFAEYAAERVDIMQGEAVLLDERGTAH